VSGTTNTAAALCIRSEAGAKDELRCGVGLVQAHCHCQHRSAVLGDSAASRNERAPTFLASPWSLLQAHQASVSMLAIKPPRRGLTQPMSLFEFPPAEDGLSATPSFPRHCPPLPRPHSDSARGDEWRQETLFCAALPGNIPSPVNVFVLSRLLHRVWPSFLSLFLSRPRPSAWFSLGRVMLVALCHRYGSNLFLARLGFLS
jgi:hypothetical protein